jgi:hypothetical protein
VDLTDAWTNAVRFRVLEHVPGLSLYGREQTFLSLEP